MIQWLPLCLAWASAELSPVVIVPGISSNQLEARLNKPSTVSPDCRKTSDWYRLWLDVVALLNHTDCWADNIRLLYNEEHDVLSNNVGVETRVPDFGATASLEEIDPSLPSHASAVFRNMVIQLVAAGHVVNKTLRGAPYDFRYAPSSPVGAEFIQDLRQLIEDTSRTNGNKPVNLISHSMGCLQVLYLLQHQPSSWKRQFVAKWIPISGAFAGAAAIVRVLASGDNGTLPVPPLKLRTEDRSWETHFWLAPVSSWFQDRVLVTTPERNYTAQDYDAFFEDIGFPAGRKLLRRVAGLTGPTLAQHPGVKVFCLYSYNVPTPESFVYGPGGFENQPQVVAGDGDGSVNEWSLQVCEHWANHSLGKEFPVQTMKFPGIQHGAMIQDDQVVQIVIRELGLTVTSSDVLV